MNIWFGLAIGIIIASPIIALVFGVGMLDTKKAHDSDWYLVGVAGCVILGLMFAIVGCVSRYHSDVTLYDVEIRAHYVDGHSTIIRKDSLEYDWLPEIREDVKSYGSWPPGNVRYEPLGTYKLYIGGKYYPAVVRFEYLKKREYIVPYKELYPF